MRIGRGTLRTARPTVALICLSVLDCSGPAVDTGGEDLEPRDFAEAPGSGSS